MKKIIFLFFIFFLFSISNLVFSQINETPINGYSPVSWDKISFFESKLIDNSKNGKSLFVSIKADNRGYIEIIKELPLEILVESYEYFGIWTGLKNLESDSISIKISLCGSSDRFYDVGSFTLTKKQIGKEGILLFHPEENLNIFFNKIKIRFEFAKKSFFEGSFDNFHYFSEGSKIVIDNFGDDEKVEEEEKSFLKQNYPNPFNPITTIKYEVLHESFVKLTVYDAIGREVKTLIDEYLSSGEYEAVFNGEELMSGTYYYKLETGDFVEVKKMILLK